LKEEKKGVPRSKLIGMQVYNPSGSFVGTIKDVSLEIGVGETGLIVSTKYQTEIEIPWTNVGAAGDIIILKEAVKVSPPKDVPKPKLSATPTRPVSPITPTPITPKMKAIPSILKKIVLKREKKLCPTCGQQLSFIKPYKRWYCYTCKKYVD